MSSARPANEQNLEFNFNGPTAKLAVERSGSIQEAVPPPKTEGASSPTHSVVFDHGPSHRDQPPSRRAESRSEPLKSPNQNASPSMSTTPSFSQFQQNIQRQSREQKTMGSLLSGVVVTLFASILFVALLAGFGTWVLWHQIQHQSVTVAQLDDKMSDRFKKLTQGLNSTTLALNMLSEQVREQKQQLTALQMQFEDLKSLERKERTVNQAFLRELQQRVTVLERREATR